MSNCAMAVADSKQATINEALDELEKSLEGVRERLGIGDVAIPQEVKAGPPESSLSRNLKRRIERIQYLRQLAETISHESFCIREVLM